MEEYFSEVKASIHI